MIERRGGGQVQLPASPAPVRSDGLYQDHHLLAEQPSPTVCSGSLHSPTHTQDLGGLVSQSISGGPQEDLSCLVRMFYRWGTFVVRRPLPPRLLDAYVRLSMYDHFQSI